MAQPAPYGKDRRRSTRRSHPRRLMPFGAVAPSGRLNCGGLGSVHADLVDLSEGGLCVMVPSPLALKTGDRVELVLHENFGLGSVQIALEVRWMAPNPMGQKLGLRFLDPAFCPSETFLKRYLETQFFSDRRSASSRRASPRLLLPSGDQGLKGELARAAAAAAPVEVQVLDLSKGGACVLLGGGPTLSHGEAVVLILRDSLSSETLRLEAQVRWMATTPEGLSVGLQFSDARFAPGKTFLRRFLSGPPRPEPPATA